MKVAARKQTREKAGRYRVAGARRASSSAKWIRKIRWPGAETGSDAADLCSTTARWPSGVMSKLAISLVLVGYPDACLVRGERIALNGVAHLENAPAAAIQEQQIVPGRRPSGIVALARNLPLAAPIRETSARRHRPACRPPHSNCRRASARRARRRFGPPGTAFAETLPVCRHEVLWRRSPPAESRYRYCGRRRTCRSPRSRAFSRQGRKTRAAQRRCPRAATAAFRRHRLASTKSRRRPRTR